MFAPVGVATFEFIENTTTANPLEDIDYEVLGAN
jgi:hypothetical protein